MYLFRSIVSFVTSCLSNRYVLALFYVSLLYLLYSGVFTVIILVHL